MPAARFDAWPLQQPMCLAVALLAVLAVAAAAPAPPTVRHPLVIIPGLTSSNLSVASSHLPLPECPPSPMWSIWPTPNITDAATGLCWSTALTTVYNPASNTVTSVPGLNVTTVGWPFFNCSSLDIILPFWQTFGFTENIDIFSACFDWRFPSLGLAAYFKQLQALVEHASATNHNLPVDLIAVSYGPQIALSFLHRMTQSWKQRYIRWFVAESPLWSGSALTPSVFAAGYDNPDNPPGARQFLRLVATKIHSLLWIFPRSGTTANYWGDSEVIIATPSRRYVASNMSALLVDLGFGDRAQSLAALQSEPDLHDFAAPGVNTFVTYGTQLPTPGNFVFTQDFVRNSSFLPDSPQVVLDPAGGDTLVPLRSSLRSLKEWPAAQRQLGTTFYQKGYPNQQHAGCCGIFDNITVICFNEVAALLLNGTVPSGLDPTE